MPAAPFRSQLAALAQRGRLRRLSPRAGRDFASNDYLGLAGDPMIAQAVADAVARGVPLGSGGSRLLRGNAPEHEGLEAKAADFFRTQAALFLANGYVANLALFSTLPQRGDLIVADELIHASVHDGIRMSKATAVFARHNDVQSSADLIAAFRAEGGKGRVWIAVETLYSMDGDMASLTDLAKLAARHEAMLLLDEAHGTGVFGPGGRGLSAGLDGLHNVVTLHTCGKAMGAEGALICGPRLLIDYLVTRARPFIYSTAPSPLMAADNRRVRRATLRQDAAEAICAPLGLPRPRSQIIPVILNEDARTMETAAALQEAGFDVRGIRPPTVPAGTSRLRVSLSLNVGRNDVLALGDALRSLVK